MRQNMYQKVDKDKLSFKFLPAFAGWILRHHLREFGIRYLQLARKLELPLLRALRNYPEDQLLELGEASNRDILENLEKNNIAARIENSLKNWVDNNLGPVQKDQIVAADIGLVFSIRRRLFQSFILDYTSERKVAEALLEEVESYTAAEELLTWSTYMEMQQEKIRLANDQLKFNQDLMQEAQALGEMGSFLIDLNDPSKSIRSPQYYKILQVTPETTLDQFLDCVDPHDRDLLENTMQGVRINGGEFEFEYTCYAGGEKKRIWTRGIAITEKGKVVQLKGLIRDITKKTRLLKQLRETELLHKEAQALTHLGHWSWSTDQHELTWSEELYSVFGISDLHEPVSVERFLSLIHPDDKDRMRHYMNALAAGNFAEEIVYRIITADGGVTKVLKTISKADFDAGGKVCRTYGTCQDITKDFRLNQELRIMNDSLGHKNRELELLNEELESFNYVASHDLQEPLRKIQIYGHRLADQEPGLSEPAVESLEKMLSAAERMQNLITDLIEFSQVSSGVQSFQPVDLGDVLAEVCQSLSEMITESGTTLEIGPLPRIRAIPFHMTQLFTNLVNNAIKYRKPEPGHRIKVSARLADSDEVGQPAGKRYHAISVEDNGIGFEPGQKDNIFELFKRLHSRDKYAGTGIGLAICKKIVHYHDGFIKGSGKPGIGAVFTVYLPVAADARVD